ncbi:MAG: glutamate synthase subunit beta [Myxococcaceae bacterium]|nr:glutamate synthase subunit beta [Myxococcaceae bacterium]
MGKTTGFLEWNREAPPKREKKERLHDSKEFVLPVVPEQSKRQAGRCMDCGVPFCQQGCPLGNPIPDFNEQVWKGRWREAYLSLTSTNNFPEFTGRLCPAPCEAACVLAVNQDPVTIEQIEKEIIERAFQEGWVHAQPPTFRTGKTVAIVGSGPAGLAAAAQLNRAGHTVIVYEKDDVLGGLLRYGIPDFKMEKWVIDRRVRLLEAEGVTFKTGVAVGTSPTWAELKASHDAVVLGIGARVGRELGLPGRELSGIVQAMDYLEAANRRVASQSGGQGPATGRRVVVLGGGDTGSDCLGTALREEAASVSQIELMPVPPTARDLQNPWPQWPLVFRTSSSQEEGGLRSFGFLTKRLVGENGALVALEGVEVTLERGKLVEHPATLRRIDVDLLILALGFTGPDTSTLAQQLGVALDSRGNVKVDRQFATSVPGVFAAGDAMRGASLIVWAISDGREAARAVDTFLTGEPSTLPTRGTDAPFGGR